MTRWHRISATVATALAIACADTAAPGGGGGGGGNPPSIVLLPTNHRALCADTASFYAVKGEDRLGRIYFDDGNCSPGEEYAELKVGKQDLYQRPDGSLIASGDSVLITFWAADPDSILFEFQPAGLLFDPSHPARFKIQYSETGDDFNHDGQSTAADTTIKHQLAIWRQATPTGSFTKLPSANFEGSDEIEADIPGFSRYAIAY